MADHADPFPAEALAENPSGHLTGDQAIRFQRMVSGRRRGARGLAVPVGAIGALLLILSGPAATAGTRQLAGWGFVAAAAVILAAPAFDPLAADVRKGQVATVQGAIGKRRTQSKAVTSTERDQTRRDNSISSASRLYDGGTDHLPDEVRLGRSPTCALLIGQTFTDVDGRFSVTLPAGASGWLEILWPASTASWFEPRESAKVDFRVGSTDLQVVLRPIERH